VHGLVLLLLPLLPFASSPAQSPVAATGDRYLVSFQIDDGDRTIGRPQFVMTGDSTATIVHSAAGGYSLKSRIEPAGPGDGDRVRLNNELYLPSGGRWSLIGRPTLTSLVDQPVSVTMPGVAGRPLRLKVTVSRDFAAKSATPGGSSATSVRPPN